MCHAELFMPKATNLDLLRMHIYMTTTRVSYSYDYIFGRSWEPGASFETLYAVSGGVVVEPRKLECLGSNSG